jgi:hypothetical protein
MTDNVNKLTLVIQDMKTKEKETVTALFGTIVLTPENPKEKMGEQINFVSRLGAVPAFEKHINRIIKEALALHKEKKDKK